MIEGRHYFASRRSRAFVGFLSAPRSYQCVGIRFRSYNYPEGAQWQNRANEFSKPAQAHRRGSIGTGQAERRKLIHEAQAYSFGSSSQENQPGTEGTLGEESVYERASSRSKTEADNVSCSSQEDRGVSTSKVGESKGSTEEGRVVSHYAGKM
jgi:hypothetical protein